MALFARKSILSVAMNCSDGVANTGDPDQTSETICSESTLFAKNQPF